MYQPVTVVTPQGQVVTQALSPGTIRIQNSQVRVPFLWEGSGASHAGLICSLCLKIVCLKLAFLELPPVNFGVRVLSLVYSSSPL